LDALEKAPLIMLSGQDWSITPMAGKNARVTFFFAPLRMELRALQKDAACSPDLLVDRHGAARHFPERCK